MTKIYCTSVLNNNVYFGVFYVYLNFLMTGEDEAVNLFSVLYFLVNLVGCCCKYVSLSHAYSRSQTRIKRNESACSVGVNAARRRSSVSQSVLNAPPRALRFAGGRCPALCAVTFGFGAAHCCDWWGHRLPFRFCLPLRIPVLHVLAFAVHVLRDRP